MVRAGERRRMGAYITGLEAVTIDFHLFPSTVPFPFLCLPISREMFDVSAVRQNAVHTDLSSGTPNRSLQVVL
jgi:hypothetical protein